MPGRITEYSDIITEIPSDFALLDMSFDDGGGSDSSSIEYRHVKGISIVAEKRNEDMGSTTTGTEFQLDWVCSGKKVVPKVIEIYAGTTGKGPETLEIRIGWSPGGDQIMKAQTMAGISAAKSVNFHIDGAIDHMESDSHTFYVGIVNGASNAFTGHVLIHANHENA